MSLEQFFALKKNLFAEPLYDRLERATRTTMY